MALDATRALQSYFTFDTHLHTSDISRCARATPYDWVSFFRLNLPWIKGSIISNHSHPPELYDPRFMSTEFVNSYYENIQEFQFFSGVEMNILRGGVLDLSQATIDKIPWAGAAMNPLTVLYGETGTVLDKGQGIADSYLKLLQNYNFDVLLEPISHIPDGQLPLINWPDIFNLCRERGIIVEVNLNLINPPWWLNALATSKCTVTFGTDWHGMYHFRRYFLPLAKEEQDIWDIVLSHGKEGYDLLTLEQRKTFDNIFFTKPLGVSLHESMLGGIEHFIAAGGKETQIFNSRGVEYLRKFLETPRADRYTLL